MLLTDLKCKALKPDVKPRKVFDGGGLYLEVTTAGSKCWRLKYRFGGKEKRLSLGIYPSVSLSKAREGQETAKKQIANGINPSEERKAAKLKQKQSSEKSFEIIAREWHETKKESYTKRHAGYVIRRLEADIFPHIGSRSIDTITAQDLLLVLRIIENRGALDVVHRALQTCSRILDML